MERRINRAINDFLKLDIMEVKLLFMLFGCDFFRRVSSLMLETASSSLFLYEFSGNYLPQIFMFTSIFMALIAFHFIRIKKLPSIAAGLTIIGLSFITFLLYLLYISGYSEITTKALMVWKTVCVVLSEITFLLIALKFCKYDWKSWRFSILLLTEALALIASGLAVTILVYFITPITLVLISGILLFISGIILYTSSSIIDKLKHMPTTHTVEGIKNSPIQIWLVLSFFMMMGLFIIGSYLVEYAFYKAVYFTYGDWLPNMTAFFAMYHVFVGFLVLILVFVFHHYEWIRGLKYTPLTIPFFIIIGSAGCLTGSLWILTIARMGKNTIYKMVMTPIAKFFSVPLLPSLGKRLSGVRRIIVEPAGICLAGVLLLYLENHNFISQLWLVLLLVSILIALFAYISYRFYTSTTFSALTNRYWWGGKLFLEDQKLKQFIEYEIMSSDVESTIYYLRAIEVSEGIDIENLFIYALNHPSYRVRLFAVSRLEALKSTKSLPMLLKIIKSDPSLEVKNRALQAYCVIGGSELYPHILSYLKNKELVSGTTIGLLKSSTEGAVIAAQTITNMLESGNKNDKIMVARILGSAKIKEYYRTLIPLLKDKNIEVRKAAVIAAGKIRSTKLICALIEALKNPALREDATEGILKLKEAALPFIGTALKDDTMYKEQNRLINILGRIRGTEARDTLISTLTNCPHTVKLQILRILNLPEYKFSTSGYDIFKTNLKSEQDRNLWLRDCQHDISTAKAKTKGEEKDSLTICEDALNNEIKYSNEIISLLKELLQNSSDLPVSFNLNSHHKEKHSHMSLNERLNDIIIFAPSNLHEWTAASAIYAMSVIKDNSFEPNLLNSLNSKHRLVRETALWALSRILPKSRMKEIAQNYIHDKNTNISDLAKFILQK